MSGPTHPHHFRYAVVLGALAAFASLSIDMYLPAFPRIARDFAAPIGSVERTLSVFLAGMALGQLLHGPLSDRYGRRVLLQVGTAVFVVSAIGCALAPSIHALMAFRLFMALGGSAGQAVSRAIVRDWFQEHDAARYFSLLLGITGVAPILAPFLGGQILEYAGWRAIFALLAAFGALCWMATTWILPESLPRERRSQPRLPQVLRVYARLLADPRFTPRVVALGFAYGTMFSYITGASDVFILGYGVSPQRFGLFFGANAFGLIGSSQLNRLALRRHTPRAILTAAYTLLVGCTALLALIGGSGVGGFWLFAVTLFFCIALLGFIYPNGAALCLAHLGAVAGSASALFGLAQFGVGAGSGSLVSLLHFPSPLPMTLPMAVFAATGYAILRLAPATTPAAQPQSASARAD